MAPLSPIPILLCTTILLWWCEADLIANVCSKAINPSLCTQTLESDPRSRGADLRGLGQIIVEISAAATNDTMRAVKSVSGGNNTGAVDVCMETCTDAIDDLNDCSQLLKAGGSAYKADLQTKASAAITNVQTCDDEFEEEDGGAEPPEVKEAGNRAKDLIDVFLVIANTNVDNLGQIAIKKAKVAVKNTATVATAVQDLNNTGAVSVCREVCGRAIEELKRSSEMLKHSGDRRSKDDVHFIVSAAVNYAFEDGVEGIPPEVKEASRIAQGLIIVVLIIASMP